MSIKQFDLEDRTYKFTCDVIALCKPIRQDTIVRPIISQLIRSSSSIGANYVEANNASSKKDFRNKIYICKKEVQETKYWLRVLKNVISQRDNEIGILWQEAHELNLIFQKIISSLDKKNEKLNEN